MRRQAAFAIVLLSIGVLASATVRAADTPAEDKIRVLVLTGGHGFQTEPFYAMFDAMEDVTYARAELPEEAGLLGPGLADKVDVLVLYDMCRKFAPEQYEQFKALLDQGIGVVALHHTLAAHQEWPEYAKILGGKYLTRPATVEGETLPISAFKHGVDFSVQVPKTSHPITRGLKDFTIHDEAYKNYWTDPQAQVLLTTAHADSDPELAWVRTYGNSRVFYLLLGHDRHAYQHPSYRTLVSRGIRWAACRPADSKAEWKSLWNGQNTDGWHQVGGSVWEVEDGILVGRQGPGNAPGDLLTNDSFDDFEAKVTFRMVWPGNSGVWYRYQSPDQSFQADILEYKQPFALTGSLYCPGKMFIATNTNPDIIDREGWNTLVIRAAGTRQIIFLNGHKLADVHDDTSDRGKLGFQIHAGAQFGQMAIHVKQVDIRPL